MKKFEAKLHRPEGKGTWTYVTVPFNVEITFGTRGRVPVCGRIDGQIFRGSLLPHGNNHHILVVKNEIRGQVQKHSGATVKVELDLGEAPRVAAQCVKPDPLYLTVSNPMKKTFMSILASTLGLFVVSANAQIEPEMVLIPTACVELGSLSIGLQSNPLREVCIESFYINRYEVTFSEYDEFTRETGLAARHDLGFGRESRPVVDVSWFDAVAYADWLSNKTGEKYRLPTDAEWEFVARAGAELGFKYSWGAELVPNLANCKDCGSTWDSQMSAPVGSFKPNSFGVYDMHGNVWEWTSDCFYADSPKKVRDLHCVVGVVRGGSWDVPATEIAFTVRAVQRSEKTAADTGFRLVREL